MSIRFSCTCDHRFDLPAEEAGTQLQCPKCMRLVDVPQLNELGAFEEDGTLKLDAAHETPSDLSAKIHAFSHRDDLRTDLDTFLDIGQPPPDPKPARPRYDPITGELLRPIEMRHEGFVVPPSPADVPMAKPALSYATPAAEPPSLDFKWWQVPGRLLLQSRSVAAMCFVWVAHVLVAGFLMMPIANFFLLPVSAILIATVIAHYGNVIDHIGPQNNDDVPVMLRGVSFTEDVWLPFLGFLGAMLFSFGPALALLMFADGDWLRDHGWVLPTMLALGVFVFPAAFLTGTASGAIENLWPPRVLRVIAAAPVRYVLALLAMLVGGTAYAFFGSYLIVTTSAGILLGGMGGTNRQIVLSMAWQSIWAGVATYAMHLSAVWLAMIYRTHHDRFRWVMQRHVKRPRDDTLARLQAMHRTGDPRVRRVKSVPVQRPPAKPAMPVLPVPQREASPSPGAKPTLNYQSPQ